MHTAPDDFKELFETDRRFASKLDNIFSKFSPANSNYAGSRIKGRTVSNQANEATSEGIDAKETSGRYFEIIVIGICNQY